jgi:glucose-6-phosphate isomerase
MNYSKQQLWQRFQKHYQEFPGLGLALDLSCMNFADDFMSSMEPRMQKASVAMALLEKDAIKNKWLDRFLIWDWVAGRTSELSAVGLLSAELQGFDIDSLLAGAEDCDEVTRRPDVKSNPAAHLAF